MIFRSEGESGSSEQDEFTSGRLRSQSCEIMSSNYDDPLRTRDYSASLDAMPRETCQRSKDEVGDRGETTLAAQKS